MKTEEEKSRETEVKAGKTRRIFSVEYKKQLLQQIDACTKRGQKGALLRKEGLYSTQVSEWRVLLENGALDSSSPKKRGPIPRVADPKDQIIASLQAKVTRLSSRLEKTEALLELQKKVGDILGWSLKEENNEKP